MTSREPTDPLNAAPVLGKKTWMAPEIRDQSIKSLTEGTKSNSPNESSPNNGPS